MKFRISAHNYIHCKKLTQFAQKERQCGKKQQHLYCITIRKENAIFVNDMNGGLTVEHVCHSNHERHKTYSNNINNNNNKGSMGMGEVVPL